MGIKTVKFGGSSLANAEQIAKAAAIIRSDPDRRYVVASAPGKRSAADVKVTDLLYQLYGRRDGDYAYTLASIRQRFTRIASDLDVEIDLDPHFATIEKHLLTIADPDYIASRGEYLNCVLLAAYLGWPLIDSADVIRFADSGEFLVDETDVLLGTALHKVERAVIPGFYGATAQGQIKTFPRGGSDVTGALVARAAMAEVYENWTDVSGILIADPRVVDDPLPIREISYTALRELTYLGASVLHENAIIPVRSRGIPINIRNTDCPEDPGTWIHTEASTDSHGPAIVGVAAKIGYTAITVRKAQWSGSLGVGPSLFRLFQDLGVVVDLAVTGVDSWTVVIRSEMITHLMEVFMDKIRTLRPDAVEVRDGLALVGVIASGTLPRTTVTVRLAQALDDARIDVFADTYVGDLRIFTIDTDRHDDAIRAIYAALVD
ncbi:MAG: aspartate kinase [Propionibacteriaceae bacterium]|nr:aspartate kinase [Propionibacteriaceae bacterium]